MANVLSQSEIDNLLSALDSGTDMGPTEQVDEVCQSEVRTYDFRTANKFSKEQIRTLKTIFDSFATALSTNLTSTLRSVCDVSVVSVEEQKFGEFNNSIPSPTIIGIVDAEPLDGSFIMTVSSTLTYAMISRVFGGEANNNNADKSFTEIELVIMKNLYKKFNDSLKISWNKIAEISPNLQRIETTSQFTQITALNEPVALITVNVKIDEVDDMMYICLPHVTLQSVIKKLNTANWTLGSGPKIVHTSKRDFLEKDISATECDLKAVLNETTATFAELYNLRPGDVICTNHSINEYITVYMEGTPKFKGIVGVAANRKVIQIAKIIKENKDSE